MSQDDIGRRQFLKAAGAGLLIVRPEQVRGTKANSAVRVGLLGCGGRGTDVAEGMVKNAGARITALADLFDDQLAKAKARLGSAQLFHGPHAFEEIAASNELDAVYIATPPYFHPEHLAAVAAAGKHVYCEKPVAVDVHGCKRVLEIGSKAQGRLSLEVGFQIRKAPPFVELVRRIHAGAIGEIGCGEAHYFAWFNERPEWPNASPTELRLRNWIHDRVLSGDIIVEQGIHPIDICNWVLKTHPIKAAGTGGRKGRSDRGNAYSHFNVIFTYPDDVHVSFCSNQFGKAFWEVTEHFLGTLGASESPYSGKLGINGENAWTWEGGAAPGGAQFSTTGTFSDNLAQADPEKQKSFIQSITSGQFHNQAEQGVEAALSAMLGRTAAYTGREVTWEELVRSDEAWDSGIDLNTLSSAARGLRRRPTPGGPSRARFQA
jgi:myo-inositol 2-dehydrogenase/D-chiro-inositol 1-dehydrogenase